MRLKITCVTKIFLLTSVIILAFICRDLLHLSILSLTIFSIMALLNREMLFKCMRIVIPMLVVAFITWTLFKGHSIFYAGSGDIDWYFGLFMAVRLSVVLATSFILVSTVKPLDLIKALSFFKLPHKAVLVAGLAFRHIHTVADDYHTIKEALTSKGLELDKGSLVKRIKNYSLVIVPLLVRCIENAEKLSLALELRSVRIENYGRFSEKFGRLDLLAVTICVMCIVFAILHYWIGVF